MTGRLGRWLATHPPCSSIADWVQCVRVEIAFDKCRQPFFDTAPAIFLDPPTWQELDRIRAILDGKSPSDLPRINP